MVYMLILSIACLEMMDERASDRTFIQSGYNKFAAQPEHYHQIRKSLLGWFERAAHLVFAETQFKYDISKQVLYDSQVATMH